MNKYLLCTISILCLLSCQRQSEGINDYPQKVSYKATWVNELKAENPFKDRLCSVYFKFDTIVNGYDVSGIFYPYYDSNKKEWADYYALLYFFRDIVTGCEYTYRSWEGFHEDFFWSSNDSKNVTYLCWSKKECGFRDGEAYIFHYDDKLDTCYNSPLFLNAEFQFFDVDYDGTDELLIGHHMGGSYLTPCFTTYELTDQGLQKKHSFDEVVLEPSTTFNKEERTITSILWNGGYQWSEYIYHIADDSEANLIRIIKHFQHEDKDDILEDIIISGS